jgi:probable rRNA maturation factor
VKVIDPGNKKPQINFHTQIDASLPFAPQSLDGIIGAIFADTSMALASLDVVVADDDSLAALHGKFLNDASPTDVITFPLHAAGEAVIGEIYVSYERAIEQGEMLSLSLAEELVRYIIHGCLHLCGYDDRHVIEQEKMRQLEDTYMAKWRQERDKYGHA